MKFGEHLKAARIQMHLTQDQVAKKFFITRQTVSNWENENTYPDIISLIKLSDYYSISLDTLLKEDSGMKEYLEKKKVAHSIKPTAILLFIIDLLFIIVFTLRWIDLLPIDHLASLMLYIFGILNAIALTQISFFQAKIGDKKHKIVFTTKRFLITTPILFLTLLISLLTQQGYIINGILSVTIFIVIFLYLDQKILLRKGKL